MRELTITTVALSNRDFPSFEAKLREAAQWVEHAAGLGADLVVLPEALNFYRGDGAGNPKALDRREVALEDWQAQTRIVLDAAKGAGVAVTVPVIEREGDGVINVSYLVDEGGRVVGRYVKMYPTPAGLESGERPGGVQDPLVWRGLRIGQMLCFDTCFPQVFQAWADAEIDLLLVPSFWPGGHQLEHYARALEAVVAVAYPAWSRIIGIDGEELAGTGYRNETLRFGFGTPLATATVNFDRVALFANHNQMKIVEVERRFGRDVRITFDQACCTYYLESRRPGLPVSEVLHECGLIRARDYFRACGAQVDAARSAAAAPV